MSGQPIFVSRRRDHNWRGVSSERTYRNRHSRTHASVEGDNAYADDAGTLGERLFGELAGLDPAQVNAKGPVPYNYRLADGTRVDVCATAKPNSRLLIAMPKKIQQRRCDVFVYVNVDTKAEAIRHIGWATFEELAATSLRRLKDNAPMVHALDRTRLRPIEELLERQKPQNLSLF